MGYVNKGSCLTAGIALGALAVLAVLARIVQRLIEYPRIRDIRLRNHLDDVFCLLAVIPTLGTAGVLAYGAYVNVLGQHNDASHVENWITTITPNFVLLEKFVYIIFVLQPLAIGFTKLSFLFFYRRIFVHDSFQMTSLFLIVITIAWITTFFFGFTFACGTSFSTNWASLAEISEKCGFGFMATVAFSIMDATLDFIILVLPFPWIWKLQMSTTRKVQICGVFMLGGFAVASAMIRMVICIEQSTPSSALEKFTVMGMPPYDILGITAAGLFWTVIETNVALIACCLPILRPALGLSAFGAILTSVGGFLTSVGSALDSSKGRSQLSDSTTSSSQKGFDRSHGGKEFPDTASPTESPIRFNKSDIFITTKVLASESYHVSRDTPSRSSDKRPIRDPYDLECGI